MTASIDPQHAIDTWDAQTALVTLAPSVDPDLVPQILALLDRQRELMALLPLDDNERALVRAAMNRFEAAVLEKAGN